MAEKIVITAKERTGRGRNDSRRLRREGKVPVTIYGGGIDTVAGVTELKDLAAIIRSESGVNTLFTLEMEGQEDARVIFQDRQIHPVTGRLIHADIRRLAKGEKIELTVPVNLIGEPAGVRDEGGLLDQVVRELRVYCTPSNIPESIDVNVEELNVGESVHLSDVPAMEDVDFMDDPESVLASVVFVKEIEEEPEVEEGLEPEIVGEEGSDEEEEEETEE